MHLIYRYRGPMVLGLLCALLGCSSSAYRPLDPAIRSHVTGTEAVVGLSRPDIHAYSANTFTGAGFYYGGFLGGAVEAIVDSSIDSEEQAKTRAKLLPLQQALQGQDFSQHVATDLAPQLAGIDWLHMSNVAWVKPPLATSYDKMLAADQSPNTLFVTLDRFLSPDYKELSVTAHVSMLSRLTRWSTVRKLTNGNYVDVPLSDDVNAVYIRDFVYLVDIPDDVLLNLQKQMQAAIPPPPPHDRLTIIPTHVVTPDDAALQFWIQDGASNMRTALDGASKELSHLIGAYLQDPAAPGDSTDEVVWIYSGSTHGRLVSRDADGRKLVLMEDGTLISTSDAVSGIRQ